MMKLKTILDLSPEDILTQVSPSRGKCKIISVQGSPPRFIFSSMIVPKDAMRKVFKNDNGCFEVEGK
jgi:hypothetical protein